MTNRVILIAALSACAIEPTTSGRRQPLPPPNRSAYEGDPSRILGDAAGSPFGDSTPSSCTPLSQVPRPPASGLDVPTACSAPGCGGDPIGTWSLDHVCAPTRELFRRVYGVCNTAQLASMLSESVSGTVTLDGTAITRQISVSGTAWFNLPNNCTFCRCTDAETSLRATGLNASCSPVCNAGTCSCDVSASISVNTSETYTLSSSTLTEQDGQTFDYCVAGNQLSLMETTGAAGTEVVYDFSQPFSGPYPEICNGDDDDGDGSIDDSPVDCPPPCDRDGVCGEGSTIACQDGRWTCSYLSVSYESPEQSCDGRDNDCNGVADNMSWCGPEVCDGRDNDGDGQIDVDTVDAQPACLTAGVCADGGAPVCEGAAGWRCHYTSPWHQATETACDRRDNDCDGVVDEPAACCIPITCESLHADCGTIDDGCGNTQVPCGACSGTDFCGGGGTPNVCGCIDRGVAPTPAAGARVGSTSSAAGTIGWAAAPAVSTQNAVDDGTRTGAAYAVLTNGTTSHYLLATDYGFSLPAAARVQGIIVEVRRKSFGGNVTDAAARLVSGGVIGTTDRSLAGNWGTTYAYVTYGDPADTWGRAWTPAEINAPGFGVALAARYTTVSGNDNALIDHVRVTVHYAIDCP